MKTVIFLDPITNLFKILNLLKEFLYGSITALCTSCESIQDSEVCARILSIMDKNDINNILNEVNLPVVSSSLLQVFAIKYCFIRFFWRIAFFVAL